MIIKAAKVEWLKMRPYRVFWILVGLYLIGMALVVSSGSFLLEFLKKQGADFNGIDPTILPLYDFEDIWQNITWIANFLKLLPAFIVVISVANDLSYTTLRQNVIDSLSKSSYILSKFSLIFGLSLASSILLLVNGLILGIIYSPVINTSIIFSNIEFIGAFLVQTLTYLSFAFLLTILIRKAGFVIVLMLGYTVIFEPIVAAILINAPFIFDNIRWLADILPARAINNVIEVPFQKYIFRETQTELKFSSIGIIIGWLIFYVSTISFIIQKRDLA